MKGFTLLEMIIVVVIIGILTAVVIPISRGYYINSRLRTENSNSRVIYNSLQTIFQEFEFAERGLTGSVFYGEDTKEGNITIYVENGEMTKAVVNLTHSSEPALTPDVYTTRTIKYSDGSTDDVTLVKALDDIPLKSGGADPNPSNFLQRVNRIFSNYKSASYVAYIENYTVKAVYASDTMDSFYIGSYPVRSGEVKDDVLEETEPSDIAAYASAAWTS